MPQLRWQFHGLRLDVLTCMAADPVLECPSCSQQRRGIHHQHVTPVRRYAHQVSPADRADPHHVDLGPSGLERDGSAPYLVT